MRGNAEAITLDEHVTVRERIAREHTHSNGNGYPRTNGRRAISRFYILSKKAYTGKRTLDVFLGSIGLTVFALVYPLIALGIKLSSKGPVIYKQKRTGQNGYTFTCLKFRTMHCFDKKTGETPDITKKGDPRVFWFGSLLRRLNLDELPQLINVVRGDMSLVGPRPYPIKECAYWNSTYDDFYYRYSVKPGISGLAQVKGYRGGTLDREHMRKRLDFDLIYVQKSSFWLDLKVIGHTILQMIHLDTNGH